MTSTLASRPALIEVDDGWPVAIDVGARLAVIVVVDGDELGWLLCLDGQMVWRWDRPLGRA